MINDTPIVRREIDRMEVSKGSGLRYGSNGTMSTDLHTASSLSSQESARSHPDLLNEFHCLSLDLTTDVNSDDSEDSMLLPPRSSESSYSDMSEVDGYYDRLTWHHRQRCSKGAWSFVKNSILTLSNFKLVSSFVIWFTTYMIMGVFGGSVAYMHFERSDMTIPDPLPDFGYDVIPYWCPSIPHFRHHGNVQSVVLFILYAIIISGIVVRWEPRYHPKSGFVEWGGDGRLILQHLFHLNSLVFITRTSTVGLTGLPQPNPRCVDQQHLPATFGNALMFVMGRGFPPHACGDLIYSGHVGCTLICMAVLHRHGFLKRKSAAVLVWVVAVIGIYFTISCRSHYSVDVVLAFYFGYFLPEWYYNRSDGRVKGLISKWIRRLEVRPNDFMRLNRVDCQFKQADYQEYPSAIIKQPAERRTNDLSELETYSLLQQ
ncbi:hypothetical protein ACHAXA_008306 [Cyclostephanos tholiformis]|uniref:Sphingomyelin synthase-like domain-containing protein n=1 Tax=Cyclostephanos tholiformis TaxID=382380 RepID=A0ABD3RTR0_9STRA